MKKMHHIIFSFGATSWSRTNDLMITNQLLWPAELWWLSGSYHTQLYSIGNCCPADINPNPIPLLKPILGVSSPDVIPVPLDMPPLLNIGLLNTLYFIIYLPNILPIP